MRAALTHFCVQHGVLRHCDFLLRRELALAITHRLDCGFGLSKIRAAAAGGGHLRSSSGNDRAAHRNNGDCP